MQAKPELKETVGALPLAQGRQHGQQIAKTLRAATLGTRSRPAAQAFLPSATSGQARLNVSLPPLA
jgi:hypothetical protein